MIEVLGSLVIIIFVLTFMSILVGLAGTIWYDIYKEWKGVRKL